MVVKHLSATEIIPEYVLGLISQLTSQNEIHILSPVCSAIYASCEPLRRSIQIAKYDLPPHKLHIKLPQYIQQIYMNWKKFSRTAFRTLKKNTPQIMAITNNEYHDPISYAQVMSFIDKTPIHLIHEKMMH